MPTQSDWRVLPEIILAELARNPTLQLRRVEGRSCRRIDRDMTNRQAWKLAVPFLNEILERIQKYSGSDEQTQKYWGDEMPSGFCPGMLAHMAVSQVAKLLEQLLNKRTGQTLADHLRTCENCSFAPIGILDGLLEAVSEEESPFYQHLVPQKVIDNFLADEAEPGVRLPVLVGSSEGWMSFRLAVSARAILHAYWHNLIGSDIALFMLQRVASGA